MMTTLEQLEHVHHYTLWPMSEWTCCTCSDCGAEYGCPQCGAVLFDLGIDEETQASYWSCWRNDHRQPELEGVGYEDG